MAGMKALLLLSAALWAQQPHPPAAAPDSVTSLRETFIESVEPDKKLEALRRLARIPPNNARDLQALFDLFMRYPEDAVRESALSSLQLANSHSPQYEPLIVRYLKDEELEGVLFALKASARIRPPSALPLVRALAEKRFPESNPQEIAILAERNQWWVQYEALSTLALWEGEKALPLILKKAEQAPLSARLLGLHFWKESLPQIERWAGGSARAREKAQHALKAPAPMPALRATRAEMLRILRDAKAPRDLRHQIALKLGPSSTPEEIAELLKEHDSLKDAASRLFHLTALFASLDPQVIPLLKKTAFENADAATRAGALAQLKGMLPAAEYGPLLEKAAASDPEPDNQREFASQLKSLK